MVAFAFSSFLPNEGDLKAMEDQFTESFFADALQRGEESEPESESEPERDGSESGSAGPSAKTYDTRALLRLLKSYAKLRIQLPVFIVDGLTELLSTSEPAGEILKPKEAANVIWYVLFSPF